MEVLLYWQVLPMAMEPEVAESDLISMVIPTIQDWEVQRMGLESEEVHLIAA